MAGTLRKKYLVYRVDVQEEPTYSTDPNDTSSPFVLFPRKDPAAFSALLTYSMMCEEGLGMEIREFLGQIAAAEPVFGTQGTRNLKAMRARAVKESGIG